MGLAYGGHVYMGPLALKLKNLAYISIAQMYAKSLKPQGVFFKILKCMLIESKTALRRGAPCDWARFLVQKARYRARQAHFANEWVRPTHFAKKPMNKRAVRRFAIAAPQA